MSDRQRTAVIIVGLIGLCFLFLWLANNLYKDDNKSRKGTKSNTEEVVKKDPIYAGVNAPPITYEIDGVQYISVLTAGNALSRSKHGDALWTFALDGTIESGDKSASFQKSK